MGEKCNLDQGSTQRSGEELMTRGVILQQATDYEVCFCEMSAVTPTENLIRDGLRMQCDGVF